MDNWTKTVFDHTIITSAFLNQLQDFIRARAPKLVPFDESNETVPGTVTTAELSEQGIMFGTNGVGDEFEVMTGDILVGTETGNLATVMSADGQDMTVKGTGKKFHF